MFDKYKVKIKLTREMLGTNPLDPNILDKHIIDRQREIIMEKSEINSAINKYLDQIKITDETKQSEIDALLAKLEDLIGYELNEEHKSLILSGKIAELKETFAELDFKATTVFLWDKKTNKPCIKDHMIYGFMKAAAEAIGRTYGKGDKQNGVMLKSVSYTQSVINQHARCEEVFIPASNDVEKDSKGYPIYNQRPVRAMTAKGPRISLVKSEILPEGTEFQFTLKVMKNSPLKEDVIKNLFDYGQLSGLGQWRNSGCGQFNYELEKLN